MKFGRKSIILAGILAGFLFTSACEGGSYNFEHKSAVEVSTSDGIKSAATYSETKSENGLLTYKINDVNLLEGKTEIYLSITNNGNIDTTLKNITISFKATDEKNNAIREGSGTFENLNVKLPKGQEVYEKFIIHDANVKNFDGGFDITCNFNDVVLNPPLQ